MSLDPPVSTCFILSTCSSYIKHKTICHPILCKMWEHKLQEHKVLMTVQEFLQELDNHGVNYLTSLPLSWFLCLIICTCTYMWCYLTNAQFGWQWYLQFGDKLIQTRRRWIDPFLARRQWWSIIGSPSHIAERIMKQFGLRQTVLAPLYSPPKKDEWSSNIQLTDWLRMREAPGYGAMPLTI